ncbi:hypothetical protein GGR54DRAFT_203178 [Hypoxylon sp. NC1633]|nr:hypothetical protein GGR54DRAFT_203178 [Hypoxylon sp. NC1633]
MPWFTDLIAPLFYLLVVATATAIPTKPAQTRADTPLCPPPNSTARIFASALYPLFPGMPDLVSPPTDDFHVQYNNQTRLSIQQAIVFTGFPAEARACAFGWAQDDAIAGILVAGGDGLLTGRQLAGFPSLAPAPASGSGVSAAAVQAFDTAGPGSAFHPDFTSWDRETRGTTHSSGPGSIACAPDIYVIFEKEHATSGNVFLKKTPGSGLFVDYNCP